MKCKNIVFRGETRKLVIEYLAAKEAAAKAAKVKEEALAKLAPVFDELGHSFSGNGKATKYLYGNIQEGGAPRYVVYKETTTSGRIDWEAYARTLPSFDESVAESFRKESFQKPSLSWATEKQLPDILAAEKE